MPPTFYGGNWLENLVLVTDTISSRLTQKFAWFMKSHRGLTRLRWQSVAPRHCTSYRSIYHTRHTPTKSDCTKLCPVLLLILWTSRRRRREHLHGDSNNNAKRNYKSCMPCKEKCCPGDEIEPKSTTPTKPTMRSFEGCSKPCQFGDIRNKFFVSTHKVVTLLVTHGATKIWPHDGRADSSIRRLRSKGPLTVEMLTEEDARCLAMSGLYFDLNTSDVESKAHEQLVKAIAPRLEAWAATAVPPAVQQRQPRQPPA